MSPDDPYATPPDRPSAPGQPPIPPAEQPYGTRAYGQQPHSGPHSGYEQPRPSQPPLPGQPSAAAYYQWPTQSPVLPVGVYAGSMGARLVARIIDFCVVGVPVTLLFLLVTLGTLSDATVDPVTGNLSHEDAIQLAIGLVSATIATVVFSILYEVWMTAVKGATLGKMAMGLKVVDIDTGELIGWGRSFVRWVIPTIGNIVCGVGGLVVYLSAFFDSAKANRGWHDLAARDVVIDTRRSGPPLP